MVSVTKATVGLCALAKIAQGFCVYNMLTSVTGNPKNTWLEVSDPRGSLKGFTQVLQGFESYACCHFQNKDCNPSRDPLTPVTINTKMYFGNLTALQRYQLTCEAGAGFTLYGDIEQVNATCTSPNGDVADVFMRTL